MADTLRNDDTKLIFCKKIYMYKYNNQRIGSLIHNSY